MDEVLHSEFGLIRATPSRGMFLDSDAAETVQEHVRRFYAEYLADAKDAFETQGKEPPPEDLLETEAMWMIIDIVFEVAYELGQSNPSSSAEGKKISVELDDDTLHVLVKRALNSLLKEE